MSTSPKDKKKRVWTSLGGGLRGGEPSVSDTLVSSLPKPTSPAEERATQEWSAREWEAQHGERTVDGTLALSALDTQSLGEPEQQAPSDTAHPEPEEEFSWDDPHIAERFLTRGDAGSSEQREEDTQLLDESPELHRSQRRHSRDISQQYRRDFLQEELPQSGVQYEVSEEVLAPATIPFGNLPSERSESLAPAAPSSRPQRSSSRSALRYAVLASSGVVIGIGIALSASYSSRSLTTTSVDVPVPEALTGGEIETTVQALPQLADPLVSPEGGAVSISEVVAAQGGGSELQALESWFETQPVPLNERVFLHQADQALETSLTSYQSPELAVDTGNGSDTSDSLEWKRGFTLDNPAQNRAIAEQSLSTVQKELGRDATSVLKNTFRTKAQPGRQEFLNGIEQRAFGPKLSN
ncbi:hypothetical protein MRY87_03010 [bacterium]|nr:hypothetical protein [bacterium]